MAEPTSSGMTRILFDALAYPFARFGWWLAVTIAGCLLMFLAALTWVGPPQYLVGRVLCLMVLAGLAVRCYLTVIENTVTGFGQEAWQDSGVRTEDMYGDLGRMLVLILGSWAPAIVAAVALPKDNLWAVPLVTLCEALGCEYFCMAVMGTVIMGGMQGANPAVVIPAIRRSGTSYALASILLILVPWSFRTGLGAFGADLGVASWAAAAAAAAFVLIMQARLVGLVYLDNQERIGWE